MGGRSELLGAVPSVPPKALWREDGKPCLRPRHRCPGWKGKTAGGLPTLSDHLGARTHPHSQCWGDVPVALGTNFCGVSVNPTKGRTGSFTPDSKLRAYCGAWPKRQLQEEFAEGRPLETVTPHLFAFSSSVDSLSGAGTPG